MFKQLYAKLPGREDSDEEVIATSVLAQLVRLRQIAISTHLLDPESDSIEGAKVKAFLDILNDIEGKVVVFSQFASCIKRLSLKLDSSAISNTYFTGKSSLEERERAISRFGDSDCRVFGTTLRAGGQGINGLQEQASVGVFFDLDWNPMINRQAVGRLKRLGATSDIVNIFLLVGDKTIEDKIIRVNERKIQLFDDVIPTNEMPISELMYIMGGSLDGFFE